MKRIYELKKSFWLTLLEQAIKALVKVNWGTVMKEVQSFWDSDLGGAEKRDLVIDQLKRAGSTTSKLILKIAVEYAYELVKQEKVK